jgi:hypothetical protein
MNLMDHLNAIARQHQADQDAARERAAAGPAGPPTLKAPILSSWLFAGAVVGFGLGYVAYAHPAPAAISGVLTAVVFRIAQGILRGLGIASGASSVNRGSGGLPQWVIGGALLGVLIGSGFMVWLDGMAADIVTPALVTAPVGAVAGLLVRGVMLLAGAGRRG